MVSSGSSIPPSLCDEANRPFTLHAARTNVSFPCTHAQSNMRHTSCAHGARARPLGQLRVQYSAARARWVLGPLTLATGASAASQKPPAPISSACFKHFSARYRKSRVIVCKSSQGLILSALARVFSRCNLALKGENASANSEETSKISTFAIDTPVASALQSQGKCSARSPRGVTEAWRFLFVPKPQATPLGSFLPGVSTLECHLPDLPETPPAKAFTQSQGSTSASCERIRIRFGFTGILRSWIGTMGS